MCDKINYGLFHVGLVSVFLFLFGCRQRLAYPQAARLGQLDGYALFAAAFIFYLI
jgi:hypothetical protein